MRTKVLFLLFILTLTMFSGVEGKTYFNKDSRFSVTLPVNWIQISKDSIKLANELKKAGYENFDYLYKTDKAGSLFDYPYILIQVIRHDEFSNARSLPKLADWKIEEMTQYFLLEMDNKFYLEKNTGRVWQKSDLLGINRITVFFPKGVYSYNIYFYCRREELEKYMPQFLSILASFKEEKPEMLVLNVTKEKSVFLIIAAIIGLIVFVTYQQFPKSKTNLPKV